MQQELEHLYNGCELYEPANTTSLFSASDQKMSRVDGGSAALCAGILGTATVSTDQWLSGSPHCCGQQTGTGRHCCGQQVQVDTAADNRRVQVDTSVDNRQVDTDVDNRQVQVDTAVDNRQVQVDTAVDNRHVQVDTAVDIRQVDGMGYP